MSHTPGQLPRSNNTYTPRDLLLGQKIYVYGRDCLLVDCDPFTRKYYKEKLGIDQVKVEIDESKATNSQKVIIPPHNGWGSEIDSLGNCIAILPKPPKIDFNKKFMYESIILRFVARIITPHKEDLRKKFILSFYCGDDSLMIHLVPEKNSGVDGGKFLERRKYKNNASGQFFQQSDLAIGANLEIGGFKFMLISADDFTFKYMEERPATFPLADKKTLIQKIGASNLGEMARKFIELCGREPINFEKFHSVLEALGIQTTFAESFALFSAAADPASQKACPANVLLVIKKELEN